MGITSLSYMGFFLVVIILYYVLPAKARWIYLLICSMAYMLISGDPILILYPLITVFITWICSRCMEGVKRREQSRDKCEKKRKIYLIIALSANLGVLLVLKYLNLGVYTFNALSSLTGWQNQAEVFRFAAPIGLSFYTLSIIGYLFDVYYEIGEAESNYAKLLLFGTYFPLLISGPIVRYRETGKKLFENHRFDYKTVIYGIQRIVIGFFKVLVISERLAIIVREVFDNYRDYPGMYIIVAATAYSIRLYTNFSGSMDIIMGISESLGIELPENFRQPFFSKTIQEFWQRWHITLGAWLKDYILYPVLRTNTFMNLPSKWKDKLGKKKAKQYTTFIAMFILWFSVGLWHGGSWKIIFGTGLLQCAYIIVSELCTPWFKAIKKKLHINDKSKLFVLFQRIRTFILITVGFMFFNAGSLRDGFRMWVSGFKITNAKILIDGSLLQLGIGRKDWIIIAVSIVLLLIQSCINEKTDFRNAVSKRFILIRWGIWYAILFFVILFGSYGPGYSAAEFIYQGF